MDVVVETLIEIPPLNGPAGWEIGDPVDVRGISPNLAIIDGSGNYIPQFPITTKRTRLVFVKSLPDVGIARLKRFLCNQEYNILNFEIAREREKGFTLTAADLTALTTVGYLTIDATGLLARSNYKPLARRITLTDINGAS